MYQLTQGDAGDAELAVETAGATGHSAAVADAAGAGVAGELLKLFDGFVTLCHGRLGVVDGGFESLALLGVFGDEFFALFVFVDQCFSGHDLPAFVGMNKVLQCAVCATAQGGSYTQGEES